MENPEKIPRSKGRTSNKLDPHMTPGPGGGRGGWYSQYS